MRRAKQYLKAILVFMIGAGFFITPTIAQDNTPRLLTDMVIENSLGDQVNYATYKDWFVECQSLKKTNTSRCELTTQITPEPDQASIGLSLKLIFENSNKPGIAIIQTPLELLLSKGIELEIDRRKLGKLTYRSCHQTGCLAPFSISGNTRRSMLNGIAAKLTVFDLQGQAKTGRFSLLGISNAIEDASRYLKQN